MAHEKTNNKYMLTEYDKYAIDVFSKNRIFIDASEVSKTKIVSNINFLARYNIFLENSKINSFLSHPLLKLNKINRYSINNTCKFLDDYSMDKYATILIYRDYKKFKFKLKKILNI